MPTSDLFLSTNCPAWVYGFIYPESASPCPVLESHLLSKGILWSSPLLLKAHHVVRRRWELRLNPKMTLFLLTSETNLRKAGLSETPELTDYKIQTHTIRLRTYSAMCLSVWLIRAQNIFTGKKKWLWMWRSQAVVCWRLCWLWTFCWGFKTVDILRTLLSKGCCGGCC